MARRISSIARHVAPMPTAESFPHESNPWCATSFFLCCSVGALSSACCLRSLRCSAHSSVVRRRNDDPPLIGKVALITGGGSGIGKTTALLFAKKGCKAVIVSGRRAGPIEETAAEIEAMGVEAMAIPCDVADQANVQEMFGAVKEKYGRLDILFNNA